MPRCDVIYELSRSLCCASTGAAIHLVELRFMFMLVFLPNLTSQSYSWSTTLMSKARRIAYQPWSPPGPPWRLHLVVLAVCWWEQAPGCQAPSPEHAGPPYHVPAAGHQTATLGSGGRWGSQLLSSCWIDRTGWRGKQQLRHHLIFKMNMNKDRASGIDPTKTSGDNDHWHCILFFKVIFFNCFTAFMKYAWAGGCLLTLRSVTLKESTQMRKLVKPAAVAASLL